MFVPGLMRVRSAFMPRYTVSISVIGTPNFRPAPMVTSV